MNQVHLGKAKSFFRMFPVNFIDNGYRFEGVFYIFLRIKALHLIILNIYTDH